MLFFVLLSSCRSPRLVIKSTPENASVSYFNQNTQNFELIGQTPLALDPNSGKLSERDLNQMSIIKVEREGYVSENILLPGDRLGSSEVILNLKASHEWLNKDRTSVSKIAEDIARKLQMINRHTNSKNFRLAIEVVDGLLNQYPKTPAFYDTKGSLHLLSNEIELARQSFQKSLELKPDGMKTREILDSLK
jgi:hypothetical protein